MIYDIVIIGAGAAGLLAALEITDTSDLTIAILEKAKRLNDARNIGVAWMGASSRSAAKIYAEPNFGGSIADIELLNYTLGRFEGYYPGKLKINSKKLAMRHEKSIAAMGITSRYPDTYQLTEDKLIKMGDELFIHLKKNATVLHKVIISDIVKEKDHYVVKCGDFETRGRKVILAMGRSGYRWISKLSIAKELPVQEQPYFEMGHRIEFPYRIWQNFAGAVENVSFSFNDFRTSIISRHSSIETEESDYLKIANGRNCKAGKKMAANFSLLKKFYSKQPYQDVYRLAEIANILCDGQLVRESFTKTMTGTGVLAPIPEFAAMVPGLEKVAEMIPGIGIKGVVYTPEVRLNLMKYELTPHMETKLDGLYIAGDMSGQTSSFLQAATTGVIAARDVIKKIRGNDGK